MRKETEIIEPKDSAILSENAVTLNAHFDQKEAAIRAAGALLMSEGAIEPAYIESMLERENVANTWLGDGVAIPHGMLEDRNLVKKDAVSVVQVPDGVLWKNGEKARLIFAIAANSDGHIDILKKLTRLLSDPQKLRQLAVTNDKTMILSVLSGSDIETIEGPHEDLSNVQEWVLDYPSGLHARPASIWVEFAKKAGVMICVRNGAYVADMKSLAELLQLGAKSSDKLVFSTDADNGAQLLDQALATVKKISANEKESAEKSRMKQKSVHGWVPPSGVAGHVAIPAGPGLSIGHIAIVNTGGMAVQDVLQGLREGAELLEGALTRTKHKMKAIVDDVTRRIGASDAAIFSAQAALLDDDNLVATACRLMADGHGAAWSWNEAVEQLAKRLSAMDNSLFAARAVDLRDVGGRVLSEIDPSHMKRSFESIGEDAIIIVAEDLSPSDTANLDPKKVKGLVTALGGPTSHTAILARTLGIPAVVAAGKDILATTDGKQIIVDGDNGLIYLEPTEQDIVAAQKQIERITAECEKQARARALPAKTSDGHEVDIAANINRADQVAFAIEQGGEGVGLMRTEFLFLESDETPDEDKQYQVYREMIVALKGKPLIVRALDIGGDKQIAHLHLPKEDNPFLGVRGARLLLRRKDLLIPQLRAIYRAAKEGGNPWIMFPMIMSISEVLQLKKLAEEIRQDLDAPLLNLGIMIEVPAAAIMADVLAAHVDFLSIGTNDLTQYTMAIDRQNPDLAPEADSLNPAVLRMIHQTASGAQRYKRWVGVCGGIAGDPFGAMLLTGFGIDELSMTPRDIPAVKARLRAHSLAEMKKLSEKALDCETSSEVRALDEMR
ncbi:MAG: fructose-specific IIA component [Candidatus Tokpelaia sp. JSC189]|nr:MAG: fructose-specific IIA component [Candidatus Tokpelaia sp. JSC189]